MNIQDFLQVFLGSGIGKMKFAVMRRRLTNEDEDPESSTWNKERPVNKDLQVPHADRTSEIPSHCRRGKEGDLPDEKNSCDHGKMDSRHQSYNP